MKNKILKIIYKIFNKIPEDVNDDGVVDSLDLLLVRKYLLKEENNEYRNSKNK